MPATTTHRLTPLQAHQLREANRLLTAVTERHSPACECVLCEARMLTDVQEGEAYEVANVTMETDE